MMKKTLSVVHAATVVGAAILLPATSRAAIGADGFDWATIGAVGNSAYAGPGAKTGRGRVDYTYRISKLEITTSQWLEFTNTFSTQTDQFNFTKYGPLFWGATFDPTYGGPGVRYRLRTGEPNAGMRPVGGISWRDAARYCNWLHNGKSSSLSSLVTGAYDTSTFGGNRTTGYTDAATHLAGAKYWIPSFDEWMKAAYYDPNRYGQAIGGWWNNMNSSDSPGTPGVPGAGTTSADLDLGNWAEWAIPLGAYSSVTSPWGLWDTSGGTSEWTEAWSGSRENVDRLTPGSFAGWTIDADAANSNFIPNADPTRIASSEGLRIATSIPSPSTIVFAGLAFTIRFRRRP